MNNEDKIPVGVVGVGYAGKHHAEKYALSPKARLVGVADIDAERARAVGAELGVAAMTDHRELFGRVRCVSMRPDAAASPAHAGVSGSRRGIAVLVESREDGGLLEEGGRARGRLARENRIGCFQVRAPGPRDSSPAIPRPRAVIREPKFVECHRLAPFVERGTDVDVVLDLMIHDIDVIASLVRAPVERVEAVGVPVLTNAPDIANARITFTNGCVANVTASRVSVKRERKIRFFQPDAYISIDYDQKRAQIYRRPEKGASWMDIRGETVEIREADALADEIDSFLDSVQSRVDPLVSGEEG